MSSDVLPSLGLIPPPAKGPATLIWDIETAPALVWVWRQWEANVIATEQDWYMLCFAYKWLGKRDMGWVGINQDPDFYEDTDDDRYAIHRAHALLDRADIIVAHNGDKFDQKKANARFLQHDLDPPAPYQQVDTLKQSRKYFAHYSHKLDELGRLHGFGQKTKHTGFDLWRRCMAGDKAAWKVMERYNRRDVRLLEKEYLKIRPWMESHPNVGFWKLGETVCPKCGSKDLIGRGRRRTAVSEFQTLQCKSCGGYSRARFREPQVEGERVTVR